MNIHSIFVNLIRSNRSKSIRLNIQQCTKKNFILSFSIKKNFKMNWTKSLNRRIEWIYDTREDTEATLTFFNGWILHRKNMKNNETTKSFSWIKPFEWENHVSNIKIIHLMVNLVIWRSRVHHYHWSVGI